MSTPLASPVPAPGGPGASFSLAPRRSNSLDGMVVGLLDSTKRNSDHLLDGIGQLLSERYALKGIVRASKPYFGNPVPADQAEELAQRCDVVITGVGD